MSEYKKEMDDYKKELYGIEEEDNKEEEKEEEQEETEKKEKRTSREKYRKEKETAEKEEKEEKDDDDEEEDKEDKEEHTAKEEIEEDIKNVDDGGEGYHREISNIDNNFIVFKNVSKNYMSDSYSVQTLALDNISFEIKEGELVIMLGHSGAGKTTTLNLLGGMDTATSGRIVVGDKEISNYSLDQLNEYRKNDIGFVFQSYNLIQNLTVKENIDLATEIKKQRVDASIILEKVGMPGKSYAFPAQLSGGEQQRVAIARAMAKKPKILLCDEPTGSLDDATGKQILSLIQKTCRDEKVTTIIITHNLQLADMADKVICFNSGKITKIITNKNPKDVEDLEW